MLLFYNGRAFPWRHVAGWQYYVFLKKTNPSLKAGCSQKIALQFLIEGFVSSLCSVQIIEPWSVLIRADAIKKICPVPRGDKSDFLVAEAGFEPATFGLWARRATAALLRGVVDGWICYGLGVPGEALRCPASFHYAGTVFHFLFTSSLRSSFKAKRRLVHERGFEPPRENKSH